MSEPTSNLNFVDTHIGLTPLSRLYMESVEHFKSAPAGIYDSAYADKLVARIEQTDTKLQNLLKACGKFNFFLLLTVATGIRGVTLFGYSLASLSFVIEALLLGSAITFFFICTTFLTSQGYKTLLRAWCSVRDPIDVENLIASHHSDDMIIRVFRSKSNLNDRYRDDFFKPRKGFECLGRLAIGSLLLVIFAVIGVHFLIQGFGALNSYVDHPLGLWPTLAILSTCTLLHLIGVLLVGLANKEFAFDIIFQPYKPAKPEHA